MGLQIRVFVCLAVSGDAECKFKYSDARMSTVTIADAHNTAFTTFNSIPWNMVVASAVCGTSRPRTVSLLQRLPLYKTKDPNGMDGMDTPSQKFNSGVGRLAAHVFRALPSTQSRAARLTKHPGPITNDYFYTAQPAHANVKPKAPNFSLALKHSQVDSNSTLAKRRGTSQSLSRQPYTLHDFRGVFYSERPV